MSVCVYGGAIWPANGITQSQGVIMNNSWPSRYHYPLLIYMAQPNYPAIQIVVARQIAVVSAWLRSQ